MGEKVQKMFEKLVLRYTVYMHGLVEIEETKKTEVDKAAENRRLVNELMERTRDDRDVRILES